MLQIHASKHNNYVLTHVFAA